MENSQMETLPKPSQNPPFTFPPHRRRPLQSNTYRIFVQIMSHCNALQSVRQHKIQDDDGNKSGEAAEKNKVIGVNRLGGAAEQNELLDHDDMETDRLVVQQKPSANVTKEAMGFEGEDATGKTVEGDLLDPMDIVTDDKNGDRIDSLMEDKPTIDGIFNPIIGQKDGGNVADTTEVSLTRQEEVDEQAFLNEVLEAVDSSLETNMVAEFSRPIEHDEKDSTEGKAWLEGIEHELQLKQKELEKLIHASGTMNSPICDDIEEGEIAGNVEVHDGTMDSLFDEAVSLEEKKPKSVEKKKRKKGPLSKEQKAKKKKKDRIKRAEKNRKLGVKRLKLQPVVKLKTVTYCRHYLKGRCQEGEKCKFSHDTIPLTKSQPCRHFARQSCMKGDDCPFDHQLSKYPCNNYVATGYCSRGADCLFSHTMAEKEGHLLLTSNVPKPESKSPFQTSDPNSKKEAKIHINPAQNFSVKIAEKKVAQLLQRPATQLPKGISIFSPLRSSPGDTGKREQAALHLKEDNGIKIGPKMTSSSSDSNQKSNDITKRTPTRTPKGINFLSFGKAPLLESGSKKNHGISESSFRSPSENDSGVETKNASGQSLLDPESNKTKVQNLISSASRPQGIKFLSFAEVPRDNSSAIGQTGLVPHAKDIGIPLVHERENALDRVKSSNEMPCGSASSSNPFSLSSHQSCARNAVGMSSSQQISLLSNTPSSVQKALQSTLAFAAKFDSKIKLDQPNRTPASSVGNQPAK